MCGLSGILDSSGTAPEELRRSAKLMADQIVLRGPDGSGVWAEPGIALSHRRLAILDLSEAGVQPMLSACEGFVLAYNGEIYNHLDLRRDLQASGASPKWRGHSDTETLLEAIAYWGLDDTLRRTVGMFSLALWDRRQRRLSLARDRIGEKPLYWGWAGDKLVFGSELKALEVHPDFEGGTCRAALSQYLRFAYVPAPRSIRPGIFKLEPGTILELGDTLPRHPPETPLRPGQSLGDLSIRSYWSLAEVVVAGAKAPLTDSVEAVDALECTLANAVSRQMISDVPLGAFLSGGVDSSIIVALMQNQSSQPVRTFTVGFDNPAFDESPHAEAVARHLGTDHTCLIVTEADALDVIPNLATFYDEPFADSSQIPTHLVCRAAHERVKVALSGDAGDELFGGYNRYILGPQVWKRIAWMPPGMRRGFGTAVCAVPQHNWDQLGSVYNRLRPNKGGIAGLGEKMHRMAQRLQAAKNLDDFYLNITSLWTNPQELFLQAETEPATVLDDPIPEQGITDPAARMMFQDMRSYLPDDILCKVDRAAMSTSLETRVPFLDADVIAFAARLPTSMKIHEGSGKWALREVLYRHVPREMIDRPKAGFSIPIGSWLRGPLRDWAEDLLTPEQLAGDGLLDPAPIIRTWQEHLSGRHDWSQRLWIILMYQAWRRKHP